MFFGTHWKQSDSEEVVSLLNNEPNIFHADSDITGLKPSKKKLQNGYEQMSSCSTPLTERRSGPIDLSWRSRLRSWRYTMVLLINLSFLTFTFMKSSMPMAIVCMTAPVSQISNERSPTVNSSAPQYHVGNFSEVLENRSRHVLFQEVNYTENIEEEPAAYYEFKWSAEIQGLILSASSILGVASPLLASWMESVIGNRYSLTIGWLVGAILTLLCPLAARIDPYCLAIVQVAMGLVLNANIPVSTSIVAWWGTQEEKLTMMSIVNAGSCIGDVLVPVIAGFLCTIRVDYGWPFIFYIFGGLTLIYCVAWFTLSAERPEDHSLISEEEREYIISHRADMGEKKPKEKLPLITIMTSVPVLAYMATVCCKRWSKLVISATLPLFLSDALQFSVAEVGMLVAVVYVVRMTGLLLWVMICNALEFYTDAWKARKLCIVVGLALGGALFTLCSFLGFPSTRWLFFILFLPAVLSQGSSGTVLLTVPLDMAPRHAAYITSILASISNVLSFSGPLVISIITRKGSPREWQTAWRLIGGIHFLGAIIFVFFGDVKLQPWACPNGSSSAHASEEDKLCNKEDAMEPLCDDGDLQRSAEKMVAE